MVAEDLVEVQSAGPQRTSTFKVVAGEYMGLNLTTLNHGDQKVLHTKAIYKLEGDRLTYCVGAPGQPRPDSFSTFAGDGNTRVVLKRARNEPRP